MPRNLLVVVIVSAAAILGSAAPAQQGRPLDPPVFLPNGDQFTTWELPLRFSKTYYVDQRHPAASDDNPGTRERPLRTINRAAQVVQPGERVVIAAGTYRERVQPARGGSGPERMISFEAAPGAEVVITGSERLSSKWSPSKPNGKEAVAGAWMAELPAGLFYDNDPAALDDSPFQQINLTDATIDKGMPWAVRIKGKPPITLLRGLVFQDGQRLRQVASYEELGAAAGAYWVDRQSRVLHCRPAGDIDPNHARFELTARGTIFAPDQYGLGYIRVKGLTIEHSGNRFPRPQQGALSTMRGHHWIIEDCTVRQCNSIGIDIGDQFDSKGPELAEGGCHIVRRNTITDCGIGGLEGKRIEHTLVEDNVIRRCGWQKVQGICETGGIKVHCTVGCLLRRNLVTDTTEAPGIWMDYTNVNSRCTQNVVLDVQTRNGGIFMEASQAPNLVDHNILWNIDANGIYQHDCDELVIAHNLVAHCTHAPVRMQVTKGRQVNGRLSTAKRNKIVKNVFLDNAQPVWISDPDNVCDWNVYGTGGDPSAWRPSAPFDVHHSCSVHIDAALDLITLSLDWHSQSEPFLSPPVPRITHDFFDQPRPAPFDPAGPFAAWPSGRIELRPNPGSM